MSADLYPSALNALLHTNGHEPNSTETQTLHALLSTFASEADTLDATYTDPESTFKILRAERKAKHDLTASVLVRELPTELLVEIFLHAVAAEFVDAALAISRTSRRWREIALDSPHLWNTLFFDGKRDLNRDEVATVLGRAKSLALDVTIERGEYSEIVFAALLAVPGFAAKVTQLHATLGIAVVFRCALIFPVFPALRSLDLILLPSRAALVECLLDMLADQPQLRQLKVVAPNVDDAVVVNNLHLPWEQFESLELEFGIEVRLVHDILIEGHALRTCAVKGIHHRPEEYPELNDTVRPASVTLPNLETLVLQSGDGERVSYPLYDRLVLPALTTLHTGGFGGNAPAYLRELRERSGCSLKTLRLESQEHPRSLLGLLEESPEIEELAIKDSPGIVFAEMAKHLSLLPNLMRFTFSTDYTADWALVEDEYWGLVKMLEARCRLSPGAACARLASVELRLKGETLDDNLEAILGGLVEDGLVKDVYSRVKKHVPSGGSRF